ncbi:MAG TPA: ATP-binding cassette domain-containing protein, partial [Bacillota bacterium]|nr:ATP-binding cassette domain-containing protein [Bacillota bacterium]
RELRKEIGWVSSSLQERLYVNETAEEIVLSGWFSTIGLYDTPDAADRELARSLLEQLNCTELAGRTYKHLSQGERQRVLIARALISHPRLLILDEPCNGLDVFAREQLLATIETLARQPQAPTMLYVTHHIEEIVPAITHVLLLNKGKVHSAGCKEAILRADNLSDFYKTPVEVNWVGQRPSMHFVHWEALTY